MPLAAGAAPGWKAIGLKGSGDSGSSGPVMQDDEMSRKIREAVARKYTTGPAAVTATAEVPVELRQNLDLLSKIPAEELQKLAAKYNTTTAQSPEKGFEQKIKEQDEELIHINDPKPKVIVQKVVSDTKLKESNNLLEGQKTPLSAERSELKEEGMNKLKAALSAFKNDLGDAMSEILTSRTGQTANEPDPVAKPASQVKVEMPSEDDQTELNTSVEDAKAAAAGKKTAQQMYGEEKQDADAPAVKTRTPESITSANKSARTFGDTPEGAGRLKTDDDSGKLVKEGQQMFGLDEKEDGADLAQVKSRDLGKVDAKGQKFKVEEFAAKPNQHKVDMPEGLGKEGTPDMFETGETSEMPKDHLPGATKVDMPVNDRQDTIYTASFSRKARKSDSCWQVSSKGKPLFAVTLAKAFPDADVRIKKWPTFQSELYGRKLVSELNKSGAKRVIDAYFGGGSMVSFYNKRTGQYDTTGMDPSKAAQPVQVSPGKIPGKSDKAQPMNISDKATNQLEDSKGGDSAIADMIADVLAPVIASSEDLTVVDVIAQLKAVFSDDESSEKFSGGLEEKVNSVKEKLAEDGAGEGEAVGAEKGVVPAEGVESTADVSKQVTSAFRGGSNVYLELLKKIKDKGKYVSELSKRYTDSEASNKKLATRVAELETKIDKEKRVRKAITIAKTLVRKGVLADDSQGFKAKITELAEVSDQSLNEIYKNINALPDKVEAGKKSIALGAVPGSVDLTPTSLNAETSIVSKDTWTSEPVVNEDDRIHKNVPEAKK